MINAYIPKIFDVTHQLSTSYPLVVANVSLAIIYGCAPTPLISAGMCQTVSQVTLGIGSGSYNALHHLQTPLCRMQSFYPPICRESRNNKPQSRDDDG